MLSKALLYGLGLAVVLAVAGCVHVPRPRYAWQQVEYPSRDLEMYFSRDKNECLVFAHQTFPDIPVQPIQPTQPVDVCIAVNGIGCKQDRYEEFFRNLSTPTARPQVISRESERNAFWNDCMIGKGWQKVRVPTETATAPPNLPEPALPQRPLKKAAPQRSESKKSSLCSSMWEEDLQEQAACQRAQRRSYDQLLPMISQVKAKPMTIESKRLKACYQKTQTWAGTDWEAIERCFYSSPASDRY